VRNPKHEDCVPTPKKQEIHIVVPASPVLTKEEVAAFLRVTPSCVTELTRRRCSRPLPFFKVGKYIRFRKSEVENYALGCRAA
jgi:excisionase family DNA binding protein